jgi:hypothetical protein
MAPPRLAKPVMPGLWVLTFGHGADSRKPVAPTIPGGDMVIERPARRMTLRQLLTHSEKCTRDLVEHFQTTVLTRITDFRDLSRPVRRRSHYPTLMAVMNALKKLQEAGLEVTTMAEYLHEQLQEIREHAKRERVNRM